MSYVSMNEIKEYAMKYLVDVSENVSDPAQFGTITSTILRFLSYAEETIIEKEKKRSIA